MLYQENIKILNSGDLLLFDTKGIYSIIIKIATFSPCSHIGMVYKKNNELFCLESDITLHKGHDGVRLIPLDERLNICKDTVYAKKLLNFNNVFLTQEIEKFCDQFMNVPYEKNILELINSAFPLFFNEDNMDSIFCSELVAYIYKKCGLLPLNVAANNYTPASFFREIKLEQGALSPQILLKDKKN